VPGVLEIGPYRFVFFSVDRTEPVHIHVKRDRQIAKFWLRPVLLAKNKGFSALNSTVLIVSWFNMDKSSVSLGMTTLTLENEPAALNVTIRDEKLIVDLVDGRTLVVPLEWYPRLVHSTDSERQRWILLGNGYAIEWPDVDEHLGIEGLIAGRRSGESCNSLERWLSTRKSV
jgi:hypothetical protein